MRSPLGPSRRGSSSSARTAAVCSPRAGTVRTREAGRLARRSGAGYARHPRAFRSAASDRRRRVRGGRRGRPARSADPMRCRGGSSRPVRTSAGCRANPAASTGVELGTVLDPPRVVEEPRSLVAQGRVAEHGLAQARPLALVLHRDHDGAARPRPWTAPYGAIVGCEVPIGTGAMSGVARVVERVGHPLGERTEQGHVDGQRLAGAVAVQQRCEDAGRTRGSRPRCRRSRCRPWPVRPAVR